MFMGFVKDAWCKGEVLVRLFLDIKSAFPSVNHDILIHDMWKQGIPMEITRWIWAKVKNCTARLLFDDYIMEQLNLPSGIDQGCPLSPILYAFYNTDLVHNETNRNLLKLLFHNNTVFLARDSMFTGAIKKLTRMMMARDRALH